MAEPAPTRRSSRTSAAPVPAAPENAGSSRSELRRRSAASGSERPTVVWGRGAEQKRADASAPRTTFPSAPVEAEPAVTATESDAATAAPAPSSIEMSTETVALAEPIVSATPAPPVAAASVSQPVAADSVAAPAVAATAPLSRRARRASQASQPSAAPVPPIAPVAAAPAERTAPAFAVELQRIDAPAPLLDPVLAPAEPFQLLAPAVEVDAPTADDDAGPDADESADADAHTDVDAAPVPALVTETLMAFAAGAAAGSALAPTPASRRRARTPPAQEPTDEAVAETVTLGENLVQEPRLDEPHVDESRLEEPLLDEARGAEASSQAAAQDEASVDEFELAARLFAFTGETPVQERAEASTDERDEAPTTQTHVAPRLPKAGRGAAFRKVATASFSVGVFGIVGLMAVGMTTPAEAVAAASGAETAMSVVAPADSSVRTIDADEIQAYVAPAGVQNDALDRTENYATTTTAELASEAGIKNFSNLFHNNPNSPIQWPFAVGVTMSYGFGMRDGRMHEGIDFTPGAGAPIQAIADGTVRVASEAGGAYGVHVIIDHMIDGELVSSHYAHMQYGSLQVKPGQHVTVGTIIGRTGNTGRSYGAHTHFEILMNGTTPIDPMPWLREHAGG